MSGFALDEKQICWLCSMGKSQLQIYCKVSLAVCPFPSVMKRVFKMFGLACLLHNKLLSKTIENKGGKKVINTYQEMQSSILVLEPQGHWVSLRWVSVESCLLHRKTLRSCPFGEPAWKEYRSYWVIKACQHLGYAAWFNPIMWMEPVIALMKSTLVWKGPWMIFFFCSFSVYM